MAVLSITKAGIGQAGKSQSLKTARASLALPSQLGADLWLDASDATTITASSGDVSQWNNKGSLGNFTQATGAVQPKTGVTTLNGLNVLDFAGDYLTAANTNEWKFLHDGTKHIIAAVWKAGTGSDPNAGYTLLGNNNGSSNIIGMLLWYDDRASASRNNAFGYNVTAGSATTNVLQTSNDKLTPNAFQVVTLISDPGNATAANRGEFFVNAGSGNKGNTDTGTPSSSNPTNALEIGRGNTFGALTGSIAEIVIVSGANATEDNRGALRDYLNTKWGIY